MMKRIAVLAALMSAMAVGAGSATAASFTGTYDPGAGVPGNTTTPTDAVGPWTLSSTDSTFGFLLRPTSEHPKFSDVTNLNVDFNSPEVVGNAGGGGGAPRFRLLLDFNSDGMISSGDKSITIHMGTAPGYVDTPAALNSHNLMNLINDDAGRYDTSAFVGGSPFTTHSTAVALLGSFDVLRLGVVLDSFGGANKTLVVTSINGEFKVPEPAFPALLAFGLVAFGALWVKRRSA